MKDIFEIAGGSVKGKLHKLDGKNNQDAYSFYADSNVIIGIVADGCGGSKNSEVGAKLAVRILEELIRTSALLAEVDLVEGMEEVRLRFLADLSELAKCFTGGFTRAIVDYFLFTLVGFVVTREYALVFSLGDGVVALNGVVKNLGPFSGNAPPYIAYGITNTTLGQNNPELLRFKVNYLVKTEDVDSLLVGTDGLGDLIKMAEKNLPGKEKLVGDLNQFWTQDKYFENPDMVRRRLSIINTESVKYIRNKSDLICDVKKENGLLSDDTTMVVLRRKLLNPGSA